MRKHLYNRPLSSFPYMPINFFTYTSVTPTACSASLDMLLLFSKGALHKPDHSRHGEGKELQSQGTGCPIIHHAKSSVIAHLYEY